MSDFFATEDDYDRLVEKVGPSRAAEIARNEGWQVRPKEVNFTPAMGGGDQMEDEDLNVATEDAADQDAAGSEGQYAGGLDAINLSNPQDVSKAILANARAQKQYYDRLAEQIKNRRYGPSESEKLFALSAALFSPTRVRGLSGTMGNVMPVLQKFGELRRTGEEERTQALQELSKQRMQLAQGNVKTALDLQRLMRTYPTGGGYDAQRGVFYNRNNPRPTQEVYNDPTLGKLVLWQDGLWRTTGANGKTYAYERYGDEYRFVREEASEGTK